MSDLDKVMGMTKEAVVIGGRLFSLAPMTGRMSGKILARAREQAVGQFFRAARAAGMAGDQINAQLSELNRSVPSSGMMAPEVIAYALALRSWDGAGKLDELVEEILDLGGGALMEASGQIMDSGTGDEKKRLTLWQLPDLEAAAAALLEHYPGLTPAALGTMTLRWWRLLLGRMGMTFAPAARAGETRKKFATIEEANAWLREMRNVE